jgi:hypothetical protein
MKYFMVACQSWHDPLAVKTMVSFVSPRSRQLVAFFLCICCATLGNLPDLVALSLWLPWNVLSLALRESV